MCEPRLFLFWFTQPRIDGIQCSQRQEHGNKRKHTKINVATLKNDGSSILN